MEISAEICASANSEGLLEQLFTLMAEDIETDYAAHGEIRPTKKIKLQNIWYGLRFKLEYANPPQGYYMYYGSDGIAWERCMKKYAMLLKENGCVFVTFPNSVSPDYSVEMCTTANGSFLIHDTDDKNRWKEREKAYAVNPDAYSAACYCDDYYGGFRNGGFWKSKDFENKANTAKKSANKNGSKNSLPFTADTKESSNQKGKVTTEFGVKEKKNNQSSSKGVQANDAVVLRRFRLVPPNGWTIKKNAGNDSENACEIIENGEIVGSIPMRDYESLKNILFVGLRQNSKVIKTLLRNDDKLKITYYFFLEADGNCFGKIDLAEKKAKSSKTTTVYLEPNLDFDIKLMAKRLREHDFSHGNPMGYEWEKFWQKAGSLACSISLSDDENIQLTKGELLSLNHGFCVNLPEGVKCIKQNKTPKYYVYSTDSDLNKAEYSIWIHEPSMIGPMKYQSLDEKTKLERNAKALLYEAYSPFSPIIREEFINGYYFTETLVLGEEPRIHGSLLNTAGLCLKYDVASSKGRAMNDLLVISNMIYNSLIGGEKEEDNAPKKADSKTSSGIIEKATSSNTDNTNAKPTSGPETPHGQKNTARKNTKTVISEESSSKVLNNEAPKKSTESTNQVEETKTAAEHSEDPKLHEWVNKGKKLRTKQKSKSFYTKYEKYVTVNPEILFEEKIYVFSGMFNEKTAENEPLLKAVLARGADYRKQVSGATNYLVIESLDSVSETAISEAVIQINKGKDLRIVLAEDLIKKLEEGLTNYREWSWKGKKVRNTKDNRSFYTKFKKYIATDPTISFEGKIFVFSGMFSEKTAMDEPIVRAVLARNGEYRKQISGLSDYLVIESLDSVAESVITDAVDQIKKGKTLQIVTADLLIEALDGRRISTKRKTEDKASVLTKSVVASDEKGKEAKANTTVKTSAERPQSAVPSKQSEGAEIKSSGDSNKTSTSKLTAQTQQLASLEESVKSISSELEKATEVEMTQEQKKALKEAQGILDNMHEQAQSTSDALKKHAENLRKQEEEKEKRIAEARARGKSSKDETDMLAVLLIEEDLGNLNRNDDEFATTFAEDFAAYTPEQLIHLRAKVRPKMYVTTFVESATEDMLSRSIKDRFGISTANWFNLCNDWDFNAKGKMAIEKTKRWYRDSEINEVQRLMEDHKESTRQGVINQLRGLKTEWGQFSSLRGDLHIVITESDEPIPKAHNLFHVLLRGNLQVYINLSNPSLGYLTVPVMNVFSSVWKVSPEEIWDTAMHNDMTDSRGQSTMTRSDAVSAKKKALGSSLQNAVPTIKTNTTTSYSPPRPTQSSTPVKPATNPNAQKIKQLEEKIRSLTSELNNVRGLFGFMKKNKLKKELANLKDEVNKLKNKQ